MVKRKLTLISGIIFGLYLIGFAAISFVLSVVIAIAKDIDLTFMIFVFPVLGIATVVGACVYKKSIIVTRIIYTISTIAYIAALVFFGIMGMYQKVSLITVLFFVFAILGILMTIISYLIKIEKINS